jgi:hypothetical protein
MMYSKVLDEKNGGWILISVNIHCMPLEISSLDLAYPGSWHQSSTLIQGANIRRILADVNRQSTTG